MKKFVSPEVQKMILEKVQLLPMLEKVSGIDEKCDAVRGISFTAKIFSNTENSIIYDNGNGILKNVQVDLKIIDDIFPDLGNFKNLISLSIPSLNTSRLFIHQWPQSLQALEIGKDFENRYTGNLAPFSGLPHLRSVLFRMGDVRLTELSPLADRLESVGFKNAIDMENIVQFTKLHTLNYGQHTGSMEPVGALQNLKTLCIETFKADTLDGLESCKGLERIRIQGGMLADIGALVELDSLRVVKISCPCIEQIDALAGSKVEVLHLNDTSVLDFSPLAGMTELQELNLSNTYFKDVELLAGLKKLERLRLSNTWVDDLEPLAGLENLETLDLVDCREIKDLSPLYGLKKLKEIKLGHTQFSRFEKNTAIPEKVRQNLIRF